MKTQTVAQHQHRDHRNNVFGQLHPIKEQHKKAATRCDHNITILADAIRGLNVTKGTKLAADFVAVFTQEV